MRIALISDIHGNLPALEAVAADIRLRGVDRIVNLGDSLSGPLLPLETARYLMASGWLSLAGNHERQILTHTPAVVACGHTHISRALRSRAGQLLCNPGSVGLVAYDDLEPVEHVVENGSPDARYAIIERASGAWSAALHSVPYDFEPMARLADLRGRPEWAYALRTGYMTA